MKTFMTNFKIKRCGIVNRHNYIFYYDIINNNKVKVTSLLKVGLLMTIISITDNSDIQTHNCQITVNTRNKENQNMNRRRRNVASNLVV